MLNIAHYRSFKVQKKSELRIWPPKAPKNLFTLSCFRKNKTQPKTKNKRVFPHFLWLRWGDGRAPPSRRHLLMAVMSNRNENASALSFTGELKPNKLQKTREKHPKLWKQTFVPFCYSWNSPQRSHSTEPSPGGPYSQFWFLLDH